MSSAGFLASFVMQTLSVVCFSLVRQASRSSKKCSRRSVDLRRAWAKEHEADALLASAALLVAEAGQLSRLVPDSPIAKELQAISLLLARAAESSARPLWRPPTDGAHLRLVR